MNIKTLTIAAALLVGASSMAMAQAGGGVGTESGKPGSAQDNGRGPGNAGPQAFGNSGGQSNPNPAGGGVGTESGKPGSAQNNDRGPGKE
jgi:hypothetical protein